MAVSQFDDGAVERQRSVRNRQCSVYASRIRPAIAPLNLDAASAPGRVAPVPEVPPMPVSPRWDSLSNGSHLINHSPTSSPGHPLDDSWSELPYRPFVASPARPVFEQPSSAAADGAESPGKSPSKAASAWAASKPRTFRSDVRSSDGVAVENFSRPRKQSIRQPVIPEQCAPEPAVPRLANLSPTDLLYEIGSTASPQTPPWPAPRRPSASSCKSASPFSSPLGPPPPVELPEPRPPFAAGQRVDGNSASSPMAGSGAPPPWMADDELRSSFRSQLTASSAYGTALTERSSVLTKDSSVTSLYANADEPSLEDVMCMYEKGFADDDDDDDDDDVEEDDEDTDFDEGPAADPHNRHHHHHHHHHHYHHAGNPSASPARAADAARHLEPAAASDQGRPVTAMSAPEPGDQSADVDLMPPLPPPARSALDAEIRQSKMIFTSPAFTASVPALSAHVDLDVIAEKRDSGKSLDSEPSVSSDPASAANEGKKATATPLTSTPTSILSTSSTTTTKTTVSPPAIPPSPSSAAFRAAMEPEDPGSRDRYGFKKQNQFITREQYDSWNKGYTQYLARRHKKWATYLKECGLMTDRPIRFPPPNAKTKRFVRKGIPPDWRGAAWFYYAGGPAILAKHSGLYEKLLDREAKPIDVEAIERDLHRTFPDNIQFQPSPPAEDSKTTLSRKNTTSSTSSKSVKSTSRVSKRANSTAAATVHHDHVAHGVGMDGRHKRVWKACERCRMKKTKCDGEFPCKRCKDDGMVCTAGVRKKVEYKQLPKGYAEVLENTQFALIATVHKLYSMVRSAQPWELGEPELNDRGQPVIHNIAQRLGCIRPNSDIDLPVHSVFPEDEAGMAELARQLEEQQQQRQAQAQAHHHHQQLMQQQQQQQQQPHHHHHQHHHQQHHPPPPSDAAFSSHDTLDSASAKLSRTERGSSSELDQSDSELDYRPVPAGFRRAPPAFHAVSPPSFASTRASTGTTADFDFSPPHAPAAAAEQHLDTASLFASTHSPAVPSGAAFPGWAVPPKVGHPQPGDEMTLHFMDHDGLPALGLNQTLVESDFAALKADHLLPQPELNVMMGMGDPMICSAFVDGETMRL
ncbi:hypothetical protein CDD83_8741 [Cordyceps sp. RAO-2017]|nr:hypothetical protein CDD83_8741 [Cordyceps sp. RAO-2017]